MGRPTYFRIQRLVEALDAARCGMTLKAIAEELDVVPRSVQRYLRDLLGDGWVEEVEPDAEGRKRWRISARAKRRIPLSVTPGELLAQRLALQATEPILAGTELEDALRTVTQKVEAALPPALRTLAAQAEQAFPVLARPARAARPGCEVIEDVLEAYLGRRVLEADYRPASRGGKLKHYRLRPVALFQYRGALYVGALSGDYEKPIRFALHRFEDVTLTRERFDLPPGFSEKAFVEQSFGVHDGEPLDVCVRFAPTVAPVVRERVWHPSQQVADLPDGGVEIRLRASGWPEIRAWVLSYGRFAELVEPAERRAEIAGELAETLGRYEGAGARR
ncbi:MAG: WYL domain-containing transcriptional regulator [Deltaproteobacteria bacterium]|nr:WYL domain-containing transcriptional regulator [Deltaproteobacteria bacterium]